MTDGSASQPPGWYYCQGDPPGTQRYWNGSAWQGDPQPVGGAPAAAAAAPMGTPGVPAEWGQRAIAYLIDIAPMVAVYLVAIVLIAIADVLAIVAILLYLGVIAYAIWNFILTQGKTGQTIGKQKQGIKLVSDATGQPVGGGPAFLRYLVAGLISGITCGVYGLLDLLWPLWDADKKRLTDKIFKFSVVNA